MPRLTLKRKSDESLILYTSDGPIEIKLGEVNRSGGKVHLDLPNNLDVLRSELLEAVLAG